MTDALPIRLALPEEAETIANLSRDTIESGLPWRWRPAEIARFIASPRHNVIVAGRIGELQGFAVMGYEDVQAYLALLAVTPARRRGGLARRLLGWLLRTADVAGIERVAVELRDDNLAARRLYEEAGFVEESRKAGGYYGRIDQIRMRLDMRPAKAST